MLRKISPLIVIPVSPSHREGLLSLYLACRDEVIPFHEGGSLNLAPDFHPPQAGIRGLLFLFSSRPACPELVEGHGDLFTNHESAVTSYSSEIIFTFTPALSTLRNSICFLIAASGSNSYGTHLRQHSVPLVCHRRDQRLVIEFPFDANQRNQRLNKKKLESARLNL
jgi:hypothetical protein